MPRTDPPAPAFPTGLTRWGAQVAAQRDGEQVALTLDALRRLSAELDRAQAALDALVARSDGPAGGASAGPGTPIGDGGRRAPGD